MGGRAGGGASGGMGRGSRQGSLARSLASVENSIRNASVEHGAIIDENGNIIWQGSDQRDGSVWIPHDLEKDRIVTHNHPLQGKNKGKDRVDGGGSLSRNDLMLAVRNNVKEMRAVAGNRVYSLKRPAKGWGIDYGDYGRGYMYKSGNLVSTPSMKKIENAYRIAHKNVEYRIDKYVKGSKDRQTAQRRASTIRWHLENKEFAKITGFSYTSFKIK